MIKKGLLFVLCLVMLLFLYSVLVKRADAPPETVISSQSNTGPAAVYTDPSQGNLRIYSFNIQVFGSSKMSKPEVVGVLVDIISQADIVAVQEVRSAAITPIEQFMSLLPGKYGYVIGPREGRSSSKEQYWVIYNTEKVAVLGTETYPDTDDIFERNPYGVFFQTAGSFDFILIDNHIQPGGAADEISALPGIIAYYRDLWNEPDVLVVGDFNADGVYYDESLLSTIFPEGDYKIIITNEYDTSVAAGDNTYDRFIITASAIEDFANNFGVIRFDELYDFSQASIAPKEVSDHYPIWAEFLINNDSD